MTIAEIRKRCTKRAAQALTRVGMWPRARALIRWDEVAAHLASTLPGCGSDYEIDHVRALAQWDLRDEQQVRQAFAASNHQWLRRGVNQSKGARTWVGPGDHA